MTRDRVTPPVIFDNRRKVNGQGHKLTHRRLATIAEIEYRDFPESVDRQTLLAQAASQLLRTKRSKALGHPNGRRNYTAKDRRANHAPHTARVHGARPSTRV